MYECPVPDESVPVSVLMGLTPVKVPECKREEPRLRPRFDSQALWPPRVLSLVCLLSLPPNPGEGRRILISGNDILSRSFHPSLLSILCVRGYVA